MNPTQQQAFQHAYSLLFLGKQAKLFKQDGQWKCPEVREGGGEMIIKLRADSAMGKNFTFGQYSKANLEFLQACGDGALLYGAEEHNMNYYKLHNGFLVHKYNAYEIQEQTK